MHRQHQTAHNGGLKPLHLIVRCGTAPVLRKKANFSTERPCSVPGGPRGVCRTGDVIVGGLFPVHERARSVNNDTSQRCDGFDVGAFLQAHVMVYSIGLINKSPMLPNLTLGYEMYDTCRDVTMAIKATLRLMEDRVNPTEECLHLRNEGTASGRGVKAVIGERHSEISIAVARLLALPLIPQISYGSTSELLSRKSKFPSFLRTVPSDKHQTKAMAKLIKTLNWESVGIIGSEDEYGKFGVESLIDNMSACLDFKVILPTVVSREEDRDLLKKLMKRLGESTAEVIVIFTKESNAKVVLEEAIGLGIINKTWIASDSWSTSGEIRGLGGIQKIGKVYGFIAKRNTVPGFEEHVRNFTAQPTREDSFFCDHLNLYTCSRETNLTGQRPGNCSLADADECGANVRRLADYIDRDESYAVYLAVNVIAQALHRLLKCDYVKCERNATFSARELLEEVKQVNFTVDNITDIAFDPNGDPSLGHDILVWDTTDGKVSLKKMGEYAPSGDIVMPEHLISEYGNVTVTASNCYKVCPYGHELHSNKDSCCKTCSSCGPNQYSPGKKAACASCQDDEYVSPQRDGCLKKRETFLEWTDGFSIVLETFSLAGFVFTLLVTALFVKHRNTPIVKGAGGGLCFLILLSLSFSFGSVSISIGKPSDFKCKARLPLFVLSFSLCVSCVLANLFQICVGFAFDAKAHGRLRRFNNPVAIVTGCMSVQVTLCAAWLALDPPHRRRENSPDGDDGVLVRCHNGSVAMFAATLGYIAFLAVVCFLFAFQGRRLPDLYRNSSFVAVGMLVYLVAWMLFIPIYLSTAGAYVQAVEASAMLVSSYSLLVCHFCPKCYVMLLRRELNDERVILEHIRKHYENKGVSPVTASK
ncbi:G-protein coupled receptor family C group 6 member A-like [Anguilla anguilla]|uniref:G-protein coupled receptor family C group 6 member A-like n=1 Tax=Anguilla anguilla TaxID=7936 RepID=UPI0015B34BBB|nr:G-protein coupled receptor family C group 6 member A-like [Anguilla anguilla]